MFKGVEPMGRGRAKAKQVKVARQLKYNSGGMDLDRLQAELGSSTDQQDENHADEDHEDHADPYAEYADRYAGEEDEGVDAST
jgi:Protein of unknown function (DUF3073)